MKEVSMPDIQPTESIIPPTPVLPEKVIPRPVMLTVAAVMIFAFAPVVGLVQFIDRYNPKYGIWSALPLYAICYFILGFTLFSSKRNRRQLNVVIFMLISYFIFIFIGSLSLLIEFYDVHTWLISYFPEALAKPALFALGIFSVLYHIVLIILLNHPTVKAYFPREVTGKRRKLWGIEL